MAKVQGGVPYYAGRRPLGLSIPAWLPDRPFDFGVYISTLLLLESIMIDGPSPSAGIEIFFVV
jgi:hypothetical protein